ncbi:unnamed protein product [Linum tenue]|uniref:DUF7733 domain-containing protein n=1 Tax=Linum tenue TaxID=586396 RepID=A0AAV0QNB0_9ROSI|nr:unnamed protein product [Linum tenue]
MSGGVGPSADITLPKDQQEEEQDQKLLENNKKTQLPPNSTAAAPRNRASLLGFYQLNSLAAIIILAASGLVGISDLAFVAFSLAYIFLLSRFAFPPLPPPPPQKPDGGNNKILDTKSKTLRLYVFVSALLGIFLPVAYICEGLLNGGDNKDGINAAAASHVFLLASQLFMEGVALGSGRFSLPVGIFIPVFYNSRRIFTLADWLSCEFAKSGDGGGGGGRRLYFGRALAVANMAFWGFNLFGLLLPVAVPICLKKYYAASLNKVSKD